MVRPDDVPVMVCACPQESLAVFKHDWSGKAQESSICREENGLKLEDKVIFGQQMSCVLYCA